MIGMKATFKGEKKLIKQLESLEALDLTDIAELTKLKMISIIDSKRKRPEKEDWQRMGGKYTAHIKDVLDVVVKSKGVGVGNVALLNKEVPYWKLINDGGAIKGQPHGVWTGQGKSDSFVFDPKGAKMIPKNAIVAMKYIELTLAWINRNLKRLMRDKVANVFKDKRNPSIIRFK